MPDHSRKAVHIAMHLDHELGQGAFSFVGARVEEARQASDHHGVRLWNDVASQLVTLGQCGRGRRRCAASGSVWGLMQRIEYYRRRAVEVESKAAEAPATHRDDMLEVAMQWRDLALFADMQARLGERAEL